MSRMEPITKDVTGLQFSIMSPDVKRKQSVVEVTNMKLMIKIFLL